MLTLQGHYKGAYISCDDTAQILQKKAPKITSTAYTEILHGVNRHI